jgi:hypothetical protein
MTWFDTIVCEYPLTPEKLELVDGHIAGEQKLMIFLLTTMGLARVAALVGRESWLAAIDDEG